MFIPNSNNHIMPNPYGGARGFSNSMPGYFVSLNIEKIEVTKALDAYRESEKYQNMYVFNKDQRDIIFEQINKDGLILKFTQHVYGNLLILKILECNDDDKDKEKHEIIYKALINDIKELSSGKYSTHVIQKLIDVVDENYLEEIANKLGVYINMEYFIDNPNSNHVIQNLINRQKKENNDKIFKSINNFSKFANDKYGCYIIIAILKNCTDNCYNAILQKSCENIVALWKDNGNYIIKFFLESEDKDKILDIIHPVLKGNIYELSKDKKAVFIIKNALKFGNENQRKDIINELLELNTDKEDPLIYLSKHQFGNYVIQDLLDYCEPETLKKVIKRIYSEPNIKKDNFGKHICDKIEKINFLKEGMFNDIIPGNHF